MNSVIKKIITSCISFKVLLSDKNMVENVLNVLILLVIKIKNQLLNMYMKTIL